MSLTSLNTLNDIIELECPICQEDYDDKTISPKLLPCHHSFCLNCLDKLEVTNGILTCPICTQKVVVPQGGVKAFQSNFYILPIISSGNFTLNTKANNVSQKTVKDNSQQPFQIFVNTLTGKTVTIDDIRKSDTIRSLKEKISVKTGVPADPQRLIHMGKQLEDHQTVASAKIEAEHTIHLLLRLLGGL